MYSPCLIASPSARGVGSTNEAPVALQSIEIAWAARTNEWPENLWVYKVIPQQFSEAVISNVMFVGSFTTKDRTQPPDGRAHDSKAICFGSAARKGLVISPSQGYIGYHDELALGMQEGPVKGVLEPLTGVPDEAETTKLGLKYLRLAGVDVSQLATKPGTTDLDLRWSRGTRGYNDKAGAEINETNSYGVSFSRRIDGISVQPLGMRGGMFISFGNHTKVVDLQVCWRNLQPYQLHDCPSPGQIGQWLRDGRIYMHKLGSKITYPRHEIRKLTVTKLQFLYSGEPGDRPMDFVLPYAIFEATAETQQGTNTVWFQSPMTFANENWHAIMN